MCVTKEEFDSSPIAWEIYKLMYAANFNKTFELSYKSRKYIINSFIYSGKSTAPMKFSGETDFNFGKGWAHTIYEKYGSLITHASIPQEYKTMYSNYLSMCNRLYKSIVNISIMPQTGNLQSTKKGIGNDRIDVFIWALNEYYNKNSNILTNYCSYENMDMLKNIWIFLVTYIIIVALYTISTSH